MAGRNKKQPRIWKKRGTPASGSDQAYEICCRPKHDWQPVCYNPGAEGYSLLLPQEALFTQVDGPVLRECLDADSRLACVGGYVQDWFLDSMG